MNKISKEMMIKEIFLMFPEKAEELANVLSECGVRCVSCCASAWETLEEGLKSHGMNDKEIDKIVNNLNKILQDN
jgi:hybrid cluster-associated redox disulfide protein